MATPIGDLDSWQFLAEPGARPLIEAATEAIAVPAERQASAISSLRKVWSQPRVHAAMQLALARHKAAGRLALPAVSEALIADPEGVEMATPSDVAAHKAGRFKAAEAAGVLDLCSGIGGDAAFVLDAEPIDLDPIRSWMASHNTGRAARVANAELEPVIGRWVHLDPARRVGGRRIARYADLVPGPATIERIAAEARGAAIKLNPGIDPAALPGGELEIISRAGTLNQAVLWTGSLRNAERSATLVDGNGRVHCMAGTPLPAEQTSIGGYIAAVDPAVERAGLLGRLGRDVGLGMPHPSLGLYSADLPVESPWLAWFEVLEVLDWNRQRVRDALAQHDAGIVEVKTRAQAVDPDREQTLLRGSGSSTITLFVYRFADAEQRPVRALITRRCRRSR